MQNAQGYGNKRRCSKGETRRRWKMHCNNAIHEKAKAKPANTSLG